MKTTKNRRSLPFFGNEFNIKWYGKLFPTAKIGEYVIPFLPRQYPKWHFLYTEEPRKLQIVQAILKGADTHTDTNLLVGLTRYFKEVELSKTEALDRICGVSLKFK